MRFVFPSFVARFYLWCVGCIVLMMALFLSACKQENTAIVSEKVPAFDTSLMDRSVLPCVDFERFVNGKWQQTAKIPQGHASWGAFEVLREENSDKVSDIITQLTKQNNKTNTEEQQIADLYASYMDTARLEQLGIQPLQPLLQKISSVQDKHALLSLLVELAPYGVSFLFSEGVDVDARNSNVNALYLAQGGLSLRDRDYYLSNKPDMRRIREKFVRYASLLLQSFGQEAKTADKLAREVLQMETQLAAFHLSKEQRRDPVKTYNKVAFATLETKYPEVQVAPLLTQLHLVSDSVIIESPAFFAQLNRYLEKTTLPSLKNYLQWRVIQNFAGYTTRYNDSLMHDFYGKTLLGINAQKERQKRAIDFVKGYLGEIVGKKYAALYFPESSKKKIAEMIENVRAVYKERIAQNTWMSDKTKAEAQKKLAAFTYKIGYPNKWKDYSALNIHKDSLLQNIWAVRAWEFNKEVEKLAKPVDKEEWLMTADQVNAYYSPVHNEIVFPAGILQPPFYNPNADDAINYGGIMGVISHEFTHGFDDQGSQYDGEGNLRDWWTDEDRKQFKKKAALFGKIYTNYKGLVSRSTINAAFTMGENIADLGGLTLSYYALEKSLKGKPTPEKIDGFTYQQRFFLSWARIWQYISTIEQEKYQVQTNTHSPPRARVNVALSNLKEFGAAWECQPTDAMQSPEQVVIW